MLRFASASTLAALGLFTAAARAEGPVVAKEPFAKAHLQMMVRAEQKDGGARMVDLEVWAQGSRLRALVRAHGAPTEVWVDGFQAEPILIKGGKVVEPRRRSLEQGLVLALRPSADLGNSKNDRVAGKPCKVVTEELKGGLSMTRCIWRGLPLSVELSGPGLAFNAAATLVEEGAVTVADLQPPAGAPPAAPSLSAGR